MQDFKNLKTGTPIADLMKAKLACWYDTTRKLAQSDQTITVLTEMDLTSIHIKARTELMMQSNRIAKHCKRIQRNWTDCMGMKLQIKSKLSPKSLACRLRGPLKTKRAGSNDFSGVLNFNKPSSRGSSRATKHWAKLPD